MTLVRAGRFRRPIVLATFMISTLAALFAVRAPAQANTCYPATSLAAHALCWLDFTGYSGAVGVATPLTFTLPDGSTLSMTVTNTGSVAAQAATVPDYTGAALANTAYKGIAGKPALYLATKNQSIQITLSGITLTDTTGRILTSFLLAGADAESLDSGDGASAYLSWTTTGTPWTQLQIMPSRASGTSTPICALTGLNTLTARCTPTASGFNAAYILSSTVSTGETVAMATSTGGFQSFAFAVELSTLTSAKLIKGRASASDQFKVDVEHSGAAISSATTSGTGTTASATSIVVAGNPYTLTDSLASGSGSLANYLSTYACTNTNTGSTTPLPTGTGTSVTITPAVDDQITCTFTNTGVSLTDVPVAPTKNVQASVSTTDTFTLTNTSQLPGTFQIGTPTIVASSGANPTATGYIFNGTTYTSVAALQAAITAAGPTAAGGSISIGIVYQAQNTIGLTDTVTLPATLAATAGPTSLQATGTETDTVSAVVLNIAKTGTTAASIGGPIAYSILVSNPTSFAGDGAAFSDPLPAGLTLVGTPQCSATGGATCGPVTTTATSFASTITKLPGGASVTFTATATGTTAGSYTNTAKVTTTGASGATSSSSLTTNVAASNGLQKSVRNVTTGEASGLTADLASPGNILEYTVSFTNTTSIALSSFVFSDTTPANTTFVSAVCGPLPSGVTACTPSGPAVGSGGKATWTFTGSLAPAATITAVLRVKVL